MSKLALVILAAGESKRFEGVKQLADVGGKPMLQVAMDHCAQVGSADIFVVLGAHSSDIRKGVDLAKVNVVESRSWDEGIGSTISEITTYLQPNYAGILFMAGDQPMVTADTLKPMIECWQGETDLICCASYDATLGIPAIFPARLFPELIDLRGDNGAKQVLLAQREKLRQFEMPLAAIDIDKPSDIPGAESGAFKY